jgi:hypothetical protein
MIEAESSPANKGNFLADKVALRAMAGYLEGDAPWIPSG